MESSYATWLPCAGLIVLACLIAWLGGSRRSRAWLAVGAAMIGFLALLDVELGVRFWVLRTGEPASLSGLQCLPKELEYPENIGHAFLHFIPNPDNEGANNLGFNDEDFQYEKRGSTVRVACIGGSTTARGYPSLLEDWLFRHKTNRSIQFEVMNFGVSGWTTTHSLVNYALTVSPFQPDYVVIHHAWNEMFLPLADCTRWDYTDQHRPLCFAPPSRLELRVIKTSIAYRWFAQRRYNDDRNPWADKRNRSDEALCRGEDGSPYWGYQHNVTLMTDLARVRDAVAVLTTQPHAAEGTNEGSFVDGANEAMRGLAQQYGDEVLFVDLDATMTHAGEAYFVDALPCSDEGWGAKAEQIGTAILEHFDRTHAADAPEGNLSTDE